MQVEGEVVHFFLYDVAEEISIEKVEKVLRRLPEFAEIFRKKPMPEYITIKPPPLSVSLGKRKIEIFGKEVEVDITVRIYAVGAISIVIKIPFKEELKELIKYHSPLIKHLEKFVKDILKKVVENIKDVLLHPIEKGLTSEKYVTFCLKFAEKVNIDKFVEENKKVLAGILRGEENLSLISENEVNDALKYKISYYENEMIIVDWGSSIILNPQFEYSDELLTFELANLQLLELRSYDVYLDKIIEKAYDDLEQLIPVKIVHIFSRRPIKVMSDLMEVRMDIGELIETTINITKFIGDWYLAKIYNFISDKLHLKEWKEIVEKKLETLEELYGMLSTQIANRRMDLLEILIILILIFWMIVEFIF